ncbi:Hypothetical protein A7982_10833 [Minicystis rosea]|nr:Hypothetical protein A7982_10833 [Minicystis rosea]
MSIEECACISRELDEHIGARIGWARIDARRFRALRASAPHSRANL